MVLMTAITMETKKAFLRIKTEKIYNKKILRITDYTICNNKIDLKEREQ